MLRKPVGSIARVALGQEKEGATCSDIETFSFGRTTGQRYDVGGSQESSTEQD